jgi:hypothetical protein
MKAELEAKLAKAESNKDATIHKRVSDAAASVVSASRLLLHVKLRLLPMTWLVGLWRPPVVSSLLLLLFLLRRRVQRRSQPRMRRRKARRWMPRLPLRQRRASNGCVCANALVAVDAALALLHRDETDPHGMAC